MRRIIPLALMAALLLISFRLLAMSSPTYRLDWYTPLTTGGGGATASTSYTINFSVGQTAAIASTGIGYNASLGYWAGIQPGVKLFLPIISR